MEKIEELDKLYAEELEKQRTRNLKRIDKLYQDNKDEIDKEFNRLKSILSDINFGATILESDYRNVFYQFSDVLTFQSGPEAVLKMLQSINVQKEIKERIKLYTKIKSEDQRKKS